MAENPLSVGMDSHGLGLGGNHGSSRFKLIKCDVKSSVSTAIVAGKDNAGDVYCRNPNYTKITSMNKID